MRIAIFTSRTDIEDSAWWRVIQDCPGLSAVLICCQAPGPRGRGLQRFWRNVRKHGPLWIPYRAGYAAVGVARRLLRRDRVFHVPVPSCVPTERLVVQNLAAPETVAQVAAWGPDLGLSLGAPILKPALFTIPSRGTLNVHEGAVPDFRGAPPAFWELCAGATEIGATVHWVDAGLDTGRVVSEARAPVYRTDSLAQLQARAEELGQRVLEAALRLVAAGDAEGRPQPAGARANRQPLLAKRIGLALRLGTARVRRAITLRALAKRVAGHVVLGLYRPLRDMARTVTCSHPLRVFNYHRVTDLCRDGMTVSPVVLEQQLAYLCRTHDLVSLAEGLAIVRCGAGLRRPAALLTFDDGYRSVHDAALPVFAAHGVVGCAFVATDLVGTERRLPHDDDNPVRSLLDVMDWAMVEQLRAAGWAVGSHSATHARLSDCRGEVLAHEVAGSRETLLARLGAAEVAMAYPYGGVHDISVEARDLIQDSGYSACFNDLFGEIRGAIDLFDLPRIELGGDHDALAWRLYVHGINLAKFRG